MLRRARRGAEFYLLGKEIVASLAIFGASFGKYALFFAASSAAGTRMVLSAIRYSCDRHTDVHSDTGETGEHGPRSSVVDYDLPARAASIAAMSIFRILIIAFIARFAAARSGSVVALSSARGVICHEKPQRSLHQPHMLS